METEGVGNRCNSSRIPWLSGRAFWGVILAELFWPIQDIVVVAEQLCGVGTSS